MKATDARRKLLWNKVFAKIAEHTHRVGDLQSLLRIPQYALERELRPGLLRKHLALPVERLRGVDIDLGGELFIARPEVQSDVCLSVDLEAPLRKTSGRKPEVRVAARDSPLPPYIDLARDGSRKPEGVAEVGLVNTDVSLHIEPFREAP